MRDEPKFEADHLREHDLRIPQSIARAAIMLAAVYGLIVWLFPVAAPFPGF